MYKVCITCVWSHLWNGDVWITLLSCTCFIEQMRTYIIRKLRDLPLKKSMKDPIIEARPPERSWADFSYTIILPPKGTFSPLTIDKTHCSSPNMPFPHMVTQDWQFDSSWWKSWYKYLFMTSLYCGKHSLIGTKDTLHPLETDGLSESWRPMQTQVQSVFTCLLGGDKIRCI